ncbi:hypothetical protein KXS07_33935 [Inquilinus limosus]|uniref:hypothetical protein n=1 Tax=Inquilinus limosus TaxID=171674 RepID=UPI003F15267F
MIKRLSIPAICGLLLSIGGCGQHLGDYRVETVRVVSGLPQPFGREISADYREYFEIDLSSATDLTAVAGQVDAVYVHADFCPIRDRHRLIAFGPIGVDGHDLGAPSGSPQQQPQPDGRFHYRFYLVPAHPMPGVDYSATSLEWPRYDLRTSDQDVCLRLFAPGYYLIHPHSSDIRIPARLLGAAVRARRTSTGPN